MVIGVLIALGLGSVYQTRQNHEREQIYLRQLVADLKETERLMDDADSRNREWDRSITALLRSYRGNGAPPRDSVLRWTTNLQFDNPVPVLGTVDALVETGDLQLIRDPQLRSALTTYLSRMREYNLPWLLTLEDEFVSARTQFRGRYDVLEAEVTADTATFANSDGSPLLNRVGPVNPYPLDVNALLADREAYFLLSRMLLAKRDFQAARDIFRAEARALRERLEQSV